MSHKDELGKISAERSNQLSVIKLTDYIIDISEDVARLDLESANNSRIQPPKDFEDAISKQYACGVEDYIVDVYNSKGASYRKGYDQLNKFEGAPNRNCQPAYISGVDTGDKTDPKAERYRKQNIFINIPDAMEKETTITKVKRNK